jgi:hypothetical protein
VNPATGCRRCWGPAELTAYWGDPLCRPCARAVAAQLDVLDEWPPVPWDDDDRTALEEVPGA